VTNRLSYGAAFYSPISSPLTTRRFTVEVFDPASTRVTAGLNHECNAQRHFTPLSHPVKCRMTVLQIVYVFFIFFIILSAVRLSPLGTAAKTGLLNQPRMIDEYGAFGGMRIGRGNRSTRRKPARAPLCPPQIPHDQTRARTRVAAVGSQRLTT
jgi:hypothetical protein